MLTVGEWVDKTHEITDMLEKSAYEKMDSEILKTRAYCEGYVQACEDFGKAMRQAITNNQG